MKRAFASLAGLIGLAALGRWLARRRHPDTSPAEPVEATAPAESQAADPAEELRRKLADARVAEQDDAPAAEVPAETLDEITRVLKIDDNVMRHLATRRPEGGPGEPLPVGAPMSDDGVVDDLAEEDE